MSNTAKILDLCRRVRASQAVTDRFLSELEQELAMDQEPEPVRKRANRKAERRAEVERLYQTNKSLRRAL